MMMKALLSADDNGGVGQGDSVGEGDRDDAYEDNSYDDDDYSTDDDDENILTLPAVII